MPKPVMPALPARHPSAGAVLALRQADWLTPERARAWSRVLALAILLGATVWIGLSHAGIDPLGKPLGTDFLSFWAASHLALSGHAAAAYNVTAHAAAERAAVPNETLYYAFFYPPTFLLLCLPLAALPYLASLAGWLLATFLPLFACLRRLLPQRWAVLPILSFPGVLLNAGQGQNGFLSGACFGGGMLLLERWPLLAGLCLGALVFKPHLLPVVPIALLAARRWSALVGVVLSSLGLCVASWAILGESAWRGFLRVAPLARATLDRGFVEPWKMQSVFAAVRVLDGSLLLAYAAQAAVALAAVAVLWPVVARRPGGRAEGAMLVTATMLCTPFLLDYDLVCLALPLAWLTAEAQRTGWRPWEKTVVLAAYALPLLARPLAMGPHLPVAPLVVGCLLLVLAGRVRGRVMAGW